jgi:hypothetical protein
VKGGRREGGEVYIEVVVLDALHMQLDQPLVGRRILERVDTLDDSTLDGLAGRVDTRERGPEVVEDISAQPTHISPQECDGRRLGATEGIGALRSLEGDVDGNHDGVLAELVERERAFECTHLDTWVQLLHLLDARSSAILAHFGLREVKIGPAIRSRR